MMTCSHPCPARSHIPLRHKFPNYPHFWHCEKCREKRWFHLCRFCCELYCYQCKTITAQESQILLVYQTMRGLGVI